MIIAYCFIGKLPEYAVDTVHQARLFYYGPIYFIISYRFSGVYDLFTTQI
jgi:hypothetical protein